MSLEEKKEKIIFGLNSVREKLLLFLSNLNESQLEMKINKENIDSWNVLEVFKHLYGAEDGMTKLMYNIKEGGTGVSDDFDLKRYNSSRVKKLNEIKSKAEILDKLNKSRENLLIFLNTLSEDDFAKKGRHAIGKILTIEQIFLVCETHERQHLEKCQEIFQS